MFKVPSKYTRNYCNLKTMLDVFCGWKIQTLNQLSGWTTSGMVIQWRWRICFWFVFVFGLFCCFACYCERSLVSLFLWWSAIPIVQWKLLKSCVNHSSTNKLVGRLLRSERMKMGGRYLMLVEEYKHEFFCDRGS